MRHTYVKKLPGKHNYASYSSENLTECLSPNGMSIHKASKQFNIPRATLHNKIYNKHSKSVGAPTLYLLKEKRHLTEY